MNIIPADYYHHSNDVDFRRRLLKAAAKPDSTQAFRDRVSALEAATKARHATPKRSALPKKQQRAMGLLPPVGMGVQCDGNQDDDEQYREDLG